MKAQLLDEVDVFRPIHQGPCEDPDRRAGDGTALGGHPLEARVSPTLEVVVEDSARRLRRRLDEASGLALIDLS